MSPSTGSAQGCTAPLLYQQKVHHTVDCTSERRIMLALYEDAQRSPNATCGMHIHYQMPDQHQQLLFHQPKSLPVQQDQTVKNPAWVPSTGSAQGCTNPLLSQQKGHHTVNTMSEAHS